jgi:aldose sugar dehydrogenase
MKKILFLFSMSFFVVLISSCKKEANSQTVGTPAPPTVVVDDWPVANERVIAQNMQYPWEILWGADNFIWATERGGKISKIDPKTGAIAFAFNIADAVAQGEGGLLGMAQDPNFLTNGFIYVVQNYLDAGTYKEKIVRFTVANNSLANPFVLLQNIPAANIHNGSRIVFGSDGNLFVSTGDAANTSLPQQSSSLAGKILRMKPDGSIPSDNPTPNSYVWSMGHRNPQGLVLANNKLYASEHGPDVEDEINIIESNRNYGWPNVTGPCNGNEITFCNNNNIKEPLFSSGSSTLAYCGLDFYGGTKIPLFTNCLLLTTLKNQTLYAIKLNATGTAVVNSTGFLGNKYGRLRDVCVSPAGRVYVCTSNGSNADKIIEIQKVL